MCRLGTGELKKWGRSYGYKIKDYKKCQRYLEDENCRHVRGVKIP